MAEVSYEFVSVRAVPLRVRAETEQQARDLAETFEDWLLSVASSLSRMGDDAAFPLPPQGVEVRESVDTCTHKKNRHNPT